jgi:hypothetical protein
MRIAVLSDSHDRLPGHVVKTIRDADEIWHLGDVVDEMIIDVLSSLCRPLRVVRGNCDHCLDWPIVREFAIDGVRIHLEHIPPRTAPDGVDLLLHGHTHVPRDEVIEGARFLNPGSVGQGNRGAPCSYAWLLLEKGRRPIWEVQLV